MKVNNIQSPSFGMALVITPGGKKFLQKKATPQMLNELQTSGTKLTDTLFWDLKVKEDGLKIARKYSPMEYAKVNLGYTPKTSQIKLQLLGSNNNVEECINYTNAAEAQQAYVRLTNSGEVPVFTEIVDKLDKEYGNKMLISDYDTMKSIAKKDRIRQESIESLVKDFGEKHS